MTDASQTEKRLAAIGLSLPPREGPAYYYDPFKRDGATVYLAGTLGKENGAVQNLGKVGAEISEKEAGRQMQICALQAMNWLRKAADGDLDRVASIFQLKMLRRLHVRIRRHIAGRRPCFEGVHDGVRRRRPPPAQRTRHDTTAAGRAGHDRSSGGAKEK